jgi:prepilin-type N-terminal cleavage/methylation domain-containing protein
MKIFNYQTTRGFTLIELMIVISIIAILSAAVIPSYKKSMANNRATMYANQLMSDLNFTKNLSINEANYYSILLPLDYEWTNSWTRGWMSYSTIYGDRRRYTFKTDRSAINSGITSSFPYAYILNGRPYPGYGPYIYTIKPPNCSTGYIITMDTNGNITKQTSGC